MVKQANCTPGFEGYHEDVQEPEEAKAVPDSSIRPLNPIPNIRNDQKFMYEEATMQVTKWISVSEAHRQAHEKFRVQKIHQLHQAEVRCDALAKQMLDAREALRCLKADLYGINAVISESADEENSARLWYTRIKGKIDVKS